MSDTTTPINDIAGHRRVGSRVMSDRSYHRITAVADYLIEQLLMIHDNGGMGATLRGPEFRDRIIGMTSDVSSVLSCEIQGLFTAVRRMDHGCEEDEIPYVLRVIEEAMKFRFEDKNP